MSTTEIKGGILEAVAKINNKDWLLMVQEMVDDFVLREKEKEKENGWDELPLDKQKEFDEALAEIEDESNLVSNEEVFKKYEKWLKE
ncbi:MAG: hypothetical protein AB8G86_06330 [Saprospiraceae bacterium]